MRRNALSLSQVQRDRLATLDLSEDQIAELARGLKDGGKPQLFSIAWFWGHLRRKAALDAGRRKGPEKRNRLRREQMYVADEVVRHEFTRAGKPPSNSEIVERYYNEFCSAIKMANGKRKSEGHDALAIVSEETFFDYIKKIGAFYRNPKWRARWVK